MMNEIDRLKVVNALEEVLRDEKFRVAPKSSAFLRYVVLQTLDGQQHRIKAYTIAVEALHKPSSFDPQEDPSVRVLAKRLRDMLAEYYGNTESHEVILQLIPGNYIPKFIMSGRIVESVEKPRGGVY